ncbi:MAG: 16S rRNA (cytosine(967)-C(5))-methyltransferase RsmB [Clostridia bacterium]|nr:16S rRNA (cytosine(967)-C(5))-methyltransferase RsmB [Clostridia bacterium]
MEDKKGYSARELAVLSLCRLEREGKYGSLEADAAIKKFGLEGSERALYTRLFYGVTERRLTLDFVINAYSNRKIDEMSLEMRNILRVSAYQILYLDRVPDYSAVNEGAELAKKYERRSASGFVNAVLRRICAEGAPEVPEKDEAEYLSIKYSVLRSTVGIYLDEFGFDATEKLLRSLFSPQYITLRVNTLKISREELRDKLTAAGIGCEPTKTSPFGLRLLQHTDTQTLFGHIKGLAYVEDEASQIAVASLDPRPGMTAADVCAAPGGKTVSAAICMENEGVIYASDIHKNKLRLIEKTADECGVGIIKTECRDAKTVNEALVCKCDRVLCDVPCSGLGVLGKKPDMRYKEVADRQRLIQTQREILKASSAYLKPNGILVYSTCTLCGDENGGNVDAFLNNEKDFKKINERTLLPHEDGTDGFYIAVIAKVR